VVGHKYLGKFSGPHSRGDAFFFLLLHLSSFPFSPFFSSHFPSPFFLLPLSHFSFYFFLSPLFFPFLFFFFFFPFPTTLPPYLFFFSPFFFFFPLLLFFSSPLFRQENMSSAPPARTLMLPVLSRHRAKVKDVREVHSRFAPCSSISPVYTPLLQAARVVAGLGLTSWKGESSALWRNLCRAMVSREGGPVSLPRRFSKLILRDCRSRSTACDTRRGLNYQFGTKVLEGRLSRELNQEVGSRPLKST